MRSLFFLLLFILLHWQRRGRHPQISRLAFLVIVALLPLELGPVAMAAWPFMSLLPILLLFLSGRCARLAIILGLALLFFPCCTNRFILRCVISFQLGVEHILSPPSLFRMTLLWMIASPRVFLALSCFLVTLMRGRVPSCLPLSLLLALPSLLTTVARVSPRILLLIVLAALSSLSTL